MTTPDLASLFPSYRAWLVGINRRPRGISRYLEQLQMFADFLEPTPVLDAITPAAVEAYKQARMEACAVSTALLALTAIRSFCRWCIREGLTDYDPTLAITWPRRNDPLPRALILAQIRELWHAIQEPEESLTDTQRFYWRRNRLVIVLMLFAGLRISEVAALCWGDVDLDAARLLVRDGKRGKGRSIPIHPMLLDELRLASVLRQPTDPVIAQQNGTALGFDSLAHVFDRWLPARVGYKITAHQLRHTFASELFRLGADLLAVQELLGHDSPETTKIYLRLDVERNRKAVGLLPGGGW